MKVAYMLMKNVSFIVTTLKVQWLTFSLLVLTGCTEIKATKNVCTGMCPNRKTISSYFYLNLFVRQKIIWQFYLRASILRVVKNSF